MCISAQGGFVIIDVSGYGSHQLSESYQDFGLLCAQRKVRRALLRTGDEDAYAHYALRDVLRAVALIAGIPLRFRLGVVASSDSTAQVCANMHEELRALGCDARVFRVERQAEQWLLASERPARRALGQVAVA
jgi:hypothetical protein